MREALVFAARHGADRILALGVLGLRVAAMGSDERPGWQAATRLYGFLRLPPGPRPAAGDGPRRPRPARRLRGGGARPSRGPRRDGSWRRDARHPAPRPAAGGRAAAAAPIPPGLSVVQG
jgi:hypothetical protein